MMTTYDRQDNCSGRSTSHLKHLLREIYDDLFGIKCDWVHRRVSWQQVLKRGEALWGQLKYVTAILDNYGFSTGNSDFECVEEKILELEVLLLWCLDPAKSVDEIPAKRLRSVSLADANPDTGASPSTLEAQTAGIYVHNKEWVPRPEALIGFREKGYQDFVWTYTRETAAVRRLADRPAIYERLSVELPLEMRTDRWPLQEWLIGRTEARDPRTWLGSDVLIDAREHPGLLETVLSIEEWPGSVSSKGVKLLFHLHSEPAEITCLRRLSAWSIGPRGEPVSAQQSIFENPSQDLRKFDFISIISVQDNPVHSIAVDYGRLARCA